MSDWPQKLRTTAAAAMAVESSRSDVAESDRHNVAHDLLALADYVEKIERENAELTDAVATMQDNLDRGL